MGNHVDGIDMEYTLDAWIKARDKLVQLDSAMSCGHARRYIYSANERAEITTSTCMMCALQSASARIAELEAERDAANRRAEVNRQSLDNALEASRSKQKIIAGLNQKIVSANRRAEQAEAERDELRLRLAQIDAIVPPNVRQLQKHVFEMQSLFEKMTCLFLAANAAKRAYRRERNLAIATGTTLLQQRDRARDALREWQEGREVNALADYADTEIRKRAEQAEADARELAERVFDTELFGDKEAEILFRYLPREQMNGAGYKNEETI